MQLTLLRMSYLFTALHNLWTSLLQIPALHLMFHSMERLIAHLEIMDNQILEIFAGLRAMMVLKLMVVT